ncbi:golgin subfamily A member 7 [Drosophila miranda]|uniref:Ras modification protein ERF4 n=1 Tax=Drosophila pseudoobscura pseudoobscura TaxID=46245 RepID=A0A6I8WEC2_DROPS|nr:golgin subfamily A member 7 [Drosophila persimilis]XP_017144646.1 golgin subfamily A member 7 [Drosophila miranda]XP_022209413.1 golgin subfamily A member 7 [Drosophila obscura]XP_026846518.1 golgin subfamily A member 7 [Drosophila persimilis]XP_033241738.1 golgin subfamily A member 7 [Drosophila pseudoobscura]
MSQGGGTPAGSNAAALQAAGGGVVFSKVFIQRDYSVGTSVKFHTRLPTELEGIIERHVFESTINRLNEFYAEAEEGSCGTYCEGCIGCITAYLIYMCSETHYEKTLRKISKFVASQNERIYHQKGLQLIDPTFRGLRVIEITIFDRPGRT